MRKIYEGNHDIEHYQKIVEAVLEQLPRLVTQSGVEVTLFDTYNKDSEEKQSPACLKRPVLKEGRAGKNMKDYIINIHLFIPGTHPSHYIGEEGMIMRYKPIIDAAGAAINDEALFICTLLHELGHCEYITQFFNLKLNLNDFDDVCRVNENKIHEVFGGKEYMISGYGMSYMYLLSDELFCDYFVYRNFPRIWKELKESALVDHIS